MIKGEVYCEGPHPAKLGSGGNVWVFVRTEHRRHYFVGPALADDGSWYHCMSFCVDADDFEKNFTKHHDGFLNMPKEYQDKVRAEHRK